MCKKIVITVLSVAMLFSFLPETIRADEVCDDSANIEMQQEQVLEENDVLDAELPEEEQLRPDSEQNSESDSTTEEEVKKLQWEIIDGNRYWYNEDGELETGFAKIENELYWFNPNGVMETGWKKLNGKLYNFGTDGKAKNSWSVIGGKTYWFRNYKMETGFAKIDNELYWFNPNGVMETGWKKLNGKLYNFGTDGKAKNSWSIIGGKTYWFRNYKMETGFAKIDNELHWFNPNGVMETGWKKVNGKTYNFGTDGKAVNGFATISNEKYLFKNYVMQVGLSRLGNDFYYSKSNGVMAINEKVAFNGGVLPIDSNGKVKGATARVLLKADNALNESGRTIRKAFLWTINNVKYSAIHKHGIEPGKNEVQSLWYAEYGFDNRKGNCYVEAATFCWMARILGQETYFVKGQIYGRSGLSNHGWCEAVIDGKLKVFDLTFSQSVGDGYNFEYGRKGTWRYADHERVD